jgi:hypothetical protein
MRNARNLVVGIALLAQLFLPGSLGTSSAAQEAQSQGDTGIDLLHQCDDALRMGGGSTTVEIMSGVNCLGYLRGFFDGYVVTEFLDQSRNNFSSSPMCLPDGGISAEQMARIVGKWLTDHPERLNESQKILVMAALVQAFPCK